MSIERTRRIIEWQTDFGAAPIVYYTTSFFEGQEEDTGNFYDSEEAAQCEVEFGKKSGKRIKVRRAHIHNIDLSKRRWSGFKGE